MASAQVAVHLTPRAHREELLGLRDGVLRARVTAPPTDGRANRALRRLVARELSIAPSRVAIVRGESSRDKLLRIEGIDVRALRRALGSERRA